MLKNPVWQKAIKACADPRRVRQFLARIEGTPAATALKAAPPERAPLLAALFGGSSVLSELLAGKPDWIAAPWLDPADLRHPRQMQGMRREVRRWLNPLLQTRDYAAGFARLREFKEREMLRIAVRDLARLGTLGEIMLEISDVADIGLEAIYDLCRQPLVERLGRPYHRGPDGTWHETGFCVVGLGKLGGQELNYSSDVDVIFVYSDEGTVFKAPPAESKAVGQGMRNHQFFTRLAEAIIAEVGRLTPEGRLFRIDVRLRPEGNAGPLVRSLESYENYYAQWGQTWERMMLIKARPLAGDPELAAEFLEMIQPFRYPRSLGERIFHEVTAMKQRIETEVIKAGEIERNVKLGRGGIREVEFIAQALQLLHGGTIPFLQGAKTLPALEKLVQYNFLLAGDARALRQAYCFLRDLEHRLQMEANRQTHTVPTAGPDRQRLAALMGQSGVANFDAALKKHTAKVRAIYDRLFKSGEPVPDHGLPLQFEGADPEWETLLAGHSFRDPGKARRVLASLVHGPGYIHVSPHTVELARQLLPQLLALCPRKGTTPPPMTPDRSLAPAADHRLPAPSPVLSDPDRVLARLDSFVTAYGARSVMFESWTNNPSVFTMLLLLFDRSEFLAEIAIRTPDLLDEMTQRGRLRRSKDTEETLKELRFGSEDADQRLWIRRYHQAELMRIGLRDILGLVDIDQNLAELTALAEACLQYALEVVLRKNRVRKSQLAIIGLGKLGGAELTYGSDLDMIFVADTQVSNLPRLQRLAVELMDLLSSQTELGVTYQTDARLRPDGAKGLMVNTLKGYEDYYRQRALLWEIQTLTRSRPVAGDAVVGRQFQEMAATLANFRQPSQPLAAYRADWKAEVSRMRLRIEKERTPAGQRDLAFKTGTGGLMDAEFVAQALCLERGWHEANTLKCLKRAQDESAIPAADAARLLEGYRNLQRLENILRRWSLAGESVLPTDPAPLYRVAVRCGYSEAATFMQAVAEWRKSIREAYAGFFR